MPKKTRKRFTSQEKVAILRLHLLEHTPVSDLCDQHGIHPTMFYRWQKEFFENASAAFEPRSRRAGDAKDRRITHLEQKLQRKNEVLSELMEEHIKLKKNLGSSEWSLGSPVHPRCGRPVPQPLGGAYRAAGLAVAPMAGDGTQQIRPLEPAVGETEPAQRSHPPRFLAGGWGEGQDRRLPR